MQKDSLSLQKQSICLPAAVSNQPRAMQGGPAKNPGMLLSADGGLVVAWSEPGLCEIKPVTAGGEAAAVP